MERLARFVIGASPAVVSMTFPPATRTDVALSPVSDREGATGTPEGVPVMPDTGAMHR